MDTVNALPFVQRVAFAAAGPGDRVDGTLTIRAGKDRYSLDTVQRLSYLDRASLHALKAFAAASKRPLVLFARYVPRPMGEQLVEAGINFVDLAGNIHLVLGSKFERTMLGRPEARPAEGERTLTAAHVQLLFAAAANPGILDRTVRDIAEHVGISKSKAADLRRQMSAQATQAPGQSETQLVSGYSQVLRPKLLLGRFRAQEANANETLERIRKATEELGVRFSLTGGPAAERLQRFYHAPELPLFIDTWTSELRSQLRLIPDRQGPLILLRAFAELVFWKKVDNINVAHPWLIYAELMHSDDPRAHEAAEELRQQYLTS